MKILLAQGRLLEYPKAFECEEQSVSDFTILNIDHLVKADKGGFRISHLDADTYLVEVSATNFIT